MTEANIPSENRQDRFLGLLGLALRAGKLAVGEASVAEALAGPRPPRAVLLARDVSQRVERKLGPKLGRTPRATLPYDKAALGRALGRESCGVCAVLDKGFCRSLLERLPGIEVNEDGGVTI